MAEKNDNAPQAKDYGVGLTALTGSTVVISGVKMDGSRYQDRVLSNVSWVPTNDGAHRLIGWDEHAGGVRTFKLANVETIVVGTLAVSGADIVAAIDLGLKLKDQVAA